MSMHRKKRYGLQLRALVLWHRTMGLTAALFVLLLAITGLPLNHTDSLGLDRRYINAGFLLDWYGIEVPPASPAFHAAGHWVSRFGEIIYLDDQILSKEAGPLFGLAVLPDCMVVAVGDELLLLTPSGRLIERLTGIHGVPAGVQNIGVEGAGRLVVRASHGDYVVDKEFLAWQAVGTAEARWSVPAALPESLHNKLAAQYRGGGLSMERVLLDIHSGRLLGGVGRYIVDGAALLMLGLVLSGVWQWVQRHRR